ncbi:MAG: hypothetical protein IT228_04505 [Flavobacteriales bacterium]|nr:hypothetical protein [Flavobacteriales bacterium]MCC6576585.1 hypothetical protein [Flavobacteriales bacterium]NUQ15763.1 hypothetical protein [Flavobacteriales bacterium]
MNAAILRKSLLLLATVFTYGYTRAAEPLRTAHDNATTLERALERQLNRHMVFPVLERTHDMTGEVTASFVVNSEGRIVVLDSWSTNEALRQYVLEKLAKVDVGENLDGIWRTTRVRFVFHPEKV